MRATAAFPLTLKKQKVRQPKPSHKKRKPRLSPNKTASRDYYVLYSSRGELHFYQFISMNRRKDPYKKRDLRSRKNMQFCLAILSYHKLFEIATPFSKFAFCVRAIGASFGGWGDVKFLGRDGGFYSFVNDVRFRTR